MQNLFYRCEIRVIKTGKIRENKIGQIREISNQTWLTAIRSRASAPTTPTPACSASSLPKGAPDTRRAPPERLRRPPPGPPALRRGHHPPLRRDPLPLLRLLLGPHPPGLPAPLRGPHPHLLGPHPPGLPTPLRGPHPHLLGPLMGPLAPLRGHHPPLRRGPLLGPHPPLLRPLLGPPLLRLRAHQASSSLGVRGPGAVFAAFVAGLVFGWLVVIAAHPPPPRRRGLTLLPMVAMMT